MPNISAAQYDALLNDDIPGLTPSRLDYLAARASSDDELRQWLNHGDDSIDVALRYAYAAEGKKLWESDRVVSSLIVPSLSDSGRNRSGALVRMGDVALYEQDQLPLLWCHDPDQELGQVLRADQQGWGLRAWAEVDEGPVGDEVLRSVGYQELGSSVGFNTETMALEGEDNDNVRFLSGEVKEVSLCPLIDARLGPRTVVSRGPLPSLPKPQRPAPPAPPAERSTTGQVQHRTWPGLGLTVHLRR